MDLIAGLRVAQPAEILLAAARDLTLLDLVIVADRPCRWGRDPG